MRISVADGHVSGHARRHARRRSRDQPLSGKNRAWERAGASTARADDLDRSCARGADASISVDPGDLLTDPWIIGYSAIRPLWPPPHFYDQDTRESGLITEKTNFTIKSWIPN